MRIPRAAVAALLGTVSAAVLMTTAAPAAPAASAVTAVPAAAPGPAPLAEVPAADGAPWPGGTVRTVGKLVLFLGEGVRRLCSAAVVDAPNGSTLATAAHCITGSEGPERPRAAWFVPGYDGADVRKRADAGKQGWKVKSFHPAPEWRREAPMEQTLPHDWGFLLVEEKHGRTLQEAVGANTLEFSAGETGEQLIAMGYPEGAPYDGEELDYCAGPAEVASADEWIPANVGNFLLSPCDLTQGSSGGPWLRDYNPATESGTLVAVISVGRSDTVMGRPFPKEAKPLFAEVSRR